MTGQKKALTARHHCITQAATLKKEFAAAIQKSPPMHLPVRPRYSFIATLARAIIGQQVSAAAARSVWKKLEILAASQGMLAFFTSDHYEQLRQCGISGKKVEFLIGLSDSMQSGDLSPRRIKRLPHGERTKVLTALKGIGQWTADMVGIFYCLDPDIFPDGDLAVMNTFNRLVPTYTSTQLLVATKQFAPYRSYLALYLWHLKRNMF